jgi:hypothetical protein
MPSHTIVVVITNHNDNIIRTLCCNAFVYAFYNLCCSNQQQSLVRITTVIVNRKQQRYLWKIQIYLIKNKSKYLNLNCVRFNFNGFSTTGSDTAVELETGLPLYFWMSWFLNRYLWLFLLLNVNMILL